MLRKILNHLDPGYHVAQINEMSEKGWMDTPSWKGVYHIYATLAENVLYPLTPFLLASKLLGVSPADAANIILVSFPLVTGITFSYGRRRKALNYMKNGLETTYQKSKVAKDFLAQKLGFKKDTKDWVNLCYPELV